MANESVKKYIYDGMYVVITKINGCVAIVQPVDDHGNNYGNTLTAPIRDLMEAGEFIEA